MIAPKLSTMPHIEITIDKDGNVKTEVHRMQGAACLAATAALEKALGIVTERTEKDHGDNRVKLGGN